MGIIFDLILLLIAVIAGFIFYPFWINLVYKYHMGEEVRDDGPRSHIVKSGTPTMGGLVFVIVVAFITFLFNRSRTQTLFPVFVAALAGLLGLVEDFSKVYKKSGLPSLFDVYFGFLKRDSGIKKIKRETTNAFKKMWHGYIEFWRVVGSNTDRGLQTYQKFMFEGLIAGFVSYWTYFKLGWDFIWFPMLGDIHIGWLYPIIIFFLFIVVLNAVAFTDGLDGLAGGLSFFSFVVFWLLASLLEFNSLAAYCATFVGALLPFLYFNVYPARIFMGNVGSHVLGASLALLAVVMHREVALILILFIFLLDGFSSPLQSLSVKFTRKRIFRMAPLHHHFELMGWPESKVTFRFWIFGILFSILGLFVALL
jgi:phospho-N-acetylmuramoyl-pentapeptide-transferase